jgi:hypothetical protein
VWASPHSRLDRPVALTGMTASGVKAKPLAPTPTALLFWCDFCLKGQIPVRRFPPPLTPNCLIVRDLRL